MTQAAFHRELSKLSQAEKLQLVQDLWDSIAEQPEDIAIDDDERKLLDERLASHRRNPRAAQPWQNVKRRIVARVKSAQRRR